MFNILNKNIILMKNEVKFNQKETTKNYYLNI